MLEKLYEGFQIIDATQPTWQNKIMRSIGYTEPGTLDPLKQILQVVQNLGVKTVVLEDEYVDPDFRDEYQHYYCKRFRDFSSNCKRLHFFEGSFTKDKLPHINLADKGYLGYSVVRPTLSYKTGRTVIKSPKDNKNTMYTICKADFDANLVGNELSVKGMPFMQQDTNVCVCAEAALWMTNRYLHRRFFSPRFKPSQVTQAATRSVTVGPVRRGLIPLQVLSALREMGNEALYFPHYDANLTAKIIYAYVESEIPVILLVKIGNEGHALVVIGHDYHVRLAPSPEWDSNIYWIDRFFVNDDAAGPYNDLIIKRYRGSGYSVEEHAAYTIVPVPPTVSMQANDVFDHVNTLMVYINRLIGMFEDSEPFRFTESEMKGLVFRTYLYPSNDFKKRAYTGMSDFFRHCYRGMRMPRYIWVTEISTAKHLNKAKSKDRRMVGEIIMDSTADRHCALTSYLAIHLFGRLLVKRPSGGDPRTPYVLYVDPTEEPYAHLVR